MSGKAYKKEVWATALFHFNHIWMRRQLLQMANEIISLEQKELLFLLYQNPTSFPLLSVFTFFSNRISDLARNDFLDKDYSSQHPWWLGDHGTKFCPCNWKKCVHAQSVFWLVFFPASWNVIGKMVRVAVKILVSMTPWSIIL